jgi:hypothetical protein
MGEGGGPRRDLGKCPRRVNRTAGVLAPWKRKSVRQGQVDRGRLSKGHGAGTRHALFCASCPHKASTESATAGATNTASASNTTAPSSSKFPRISTAERVGSRISMNCPGMARVSNCRTLRLTPPLGGINKKATDNRRRSDSVHALAGMPHLHSVLLAGEIDSEIVPGIADAEADKGRVPGIGVNYLPARRQTKI